MRSEANCVDDNKTEVDEGDQKCRNEFAHSVISGRLAVYFYLFQNVDAIDYAQTYKIDKRNDHKQRDKYFEYQQNYIKRLAFHIAYLLELNKVDARIEYYCYYSGNVLIEFGIGE